MRVATLGYSNSEVQFGMKKNKKKREIYQNHSISSSFSSGGLPASMFDLVKINNTPAKDLKPPIHISDFEGDLKNLHNMSALQNIENKHGYFTLVDVITHDFMTPVGTKPTLIDALHKKGVFSAEDTETKKRIIAQVINEGKTANWKTKTPVQLLKDNVEFKDLPTNSPLRNAITRELMETPKIDSLSSTSSIQVTGSKSNFSSSLKDQLQKLSKKDDGSESMFGNVMKTAQKATSSTINFVFSKFINSDKRITQPENE